MLVGCRFIHCHTRSCSSALQSWIPRWSVKLKNCGSVTRPSDSLLLMQLMLKRGGYKSTDFISLLMLSRAIHLPWWLSCKYSCSLPCTVDSFLQSEIITTTIYQVCLCVISYKGLDHKLCDRNSNVTDSSRCCICRLLHAIMQYDEIPCTGRVLECCTICW